MVKWYEWTKHYHRHGRDLVQVTVSAASGCTYVPIAVAVFVDPAPEGFIQGIITNEFGQNIGLANETLSVCAGEDVNFIATTYGNYQYEWQGAKPAKPFHSAKSATTCWLLAITLILSPSPTLAVVARL